MLAALFTVLLTASPKVLVVKSQDLASYASVVAGFTSVVQGDVQQLTLDDGAKETLERTFKSAADTQPALVLAIGPAAAVGAMNAFDKVPVIFVMVPYFKLYRLERQNITGISLTSDLSLELQATRSLLPYVRRIGVAFDPRYSREFIDAATSAAMSKNVDLVPLEVDAPDKVVKVLKAARGKVDALMMIADRTVGNAAVVQRTLAWAQEEGVPVVGFAPAQVKEGALFALAPAATGLGQQAGRLANRILHEKVDPGALAVSAPEGVELHVNLGTARRLPDAKAFAFELMGFAAKQQISVRVNE
ncbi:MAG: ABC transporter substrate-binding protein [Archangiaceae bacterium]|nr:ABC transporter substrate-binding protein [Archangiaceae bacterium]